MSTPSYTTTAETRLSERLGAAALRGVAADPTIDVRGRRIEVDHRPIGLVVPHLMLDDTVAGVRRRGVLDAIGLRVRHSDRALHLDLSPEPPLERVIFDIAEQFRCEALADPTLVGVRSNTREAYVAWTESALGNRIDETGIGLMLFTITQMLRFRLLRQPATADVDDAIEATRSNLGRLVGHALRELPGLIHSQEAFAEPAREIARLIAEMSEDGEESDGPTPEADERNRLLIPVDWDSLAEELIAEADRVSPAGGTSDYRVFTTANDRQTRGDQLYRAEVLLGLRRRLDEQVRAQAVSVARLSQRLARVFPATVVDGWTGGQIDGALDPARLGQIVADPANPLVFRQPHETTTTDTAVTFLVDTTGSMKVQRFEAMAVLVDTFVRALDVLGAATEVLGFTTAAWAGGESAVEWRSSGSPEQPGRVCDLEHIVYKSADVPWRQARHSMAAMMRTDHYREGVDGEALLWARSRLLQRSESRRVLVMISDGWPSEATTATANGDDYLSDHFRAVVADIERTRGDVELGVISLDRDVADSVERSAVIDLDGTLTIGTYQVLAELFG